MPTPAFDDMPFSIELRQALKEMGYAGPTPIQALAIPPLLAGRDLVGQSETGSGKTSAFAIPLLEGVEVATRQLQALVLCPTRELCAQVAREIRKLGRHKKDVQVLTLSGGHPVYLDLKSLRHGAQIVVGTPGRVQDHLSRRSLDLSAVRFVVLDEADRMLDMGFREAIEAILELTPKSRQTSLFSATFPETIDNLAKRFLRSPERFTVEMSVADTPAIEQLFFRATDETKTETLISFLGSRRLDSALVFCNLRAGVDEVTESLRRAGHSADKIHGNLEQRDRDCVMAKFRNRSTRFLVATDVAARGIDVAALDAVINYDMPRDPEVYVHRIGRTGRAGAKGLAVTLVTERERPKIERLEGYLGTTISVSKPPSPKARSTTAPAAMETLTISGGRKDKLRPGDILGALTGDAGIQGDQIGKIEILDRVSYVAIARASSRLALERMKAVRIKGRRFVVHGVR